MNKRSLLIVLVLVYGVVLVSCGSEKTKKVSEYETGMESNQITAEETTTQKDIVEDTTVKEVNAEVTTSQGTAVKDNTTEKVSVEETTVEEATTKLPVENSDNNGYIYTRNYNDKKSIQILGDLGISSEELSKIENLIKSYNRDMSFKVVSIDGTRGLSYNSDKTYFAASSTKAPYLLYCHKQIDAGNGTLNEKMKYSSSYYDDGSGIINQSADGKEYTLAEIMRLVVWCSDNSGYYMCTKRWGIEGYNSFISNMGCSSLKISNGYIWVDKANVHDLIAVWKNIYDYTKSNAPSAKHLYDICIDYKYNPLENALPGVTIAQKYGTSATKDVFCDGAIIYGKKNTYLLAFFLGSSNDSKDKVFVTNLVKELNLIMDR